MKSRWYHIFSVTVVALLLWETPVFAGTTIQLNPDEYWAYSYYHDALGNEQVQAMKPAQRLPAIAKDIGMSAKAVQQIIDKVDSHYTGNLLDLAKAAIMDGIKGSALDGRVQEIVFDDSNLHHVVAYVKWKADDRRLLEEEASLIAGLVGKHVGFIQTLGVWAVHPRGPDTKVFSAKISRVGMDRIDGSKVQNLADRLYMKLFEDVQYPVAF